MKIKILKNGFEQNLKMPAKIGDVGYDLVAGNIKIVGKEVYVSQDQEETFYSSIDYIEYDTGIALEPVHKNRVFDESGYGFIIANEGDMDISKYVQVKPRSSLSNYNLSLKNHVATIDPNFRGTIKCRFAYLWQPEDLMWDSENSRMYGTINKEKIYKIGDKIAQCVFSNVIHPEIEYVDKLSDSDRQDAGFGSTNIKYSQN